MYGSSEPKRQSWILVSPRVAAHSAPAALSLRGISVLCAPLLGAHTFADHVDTVSWVTSVRGYGVV